MRRFIFSLVIAAAGAGSAFAEVDVMTYRATKEGQLGNRERPGILRQYARLPGTTIQGPKGSFTIRKIHYSGQSAQMIAFDTKSNGIQEVGMAIMQNTDCRIPHRGIVYPINIGFSRNGFAFYCSSR